MSYQNQGGGGGYQYSNVPPVDQGGPPPADSPSNFKQNASSSSGGNYQLPSYSDYTQNGNSYDFGSYGPNLGSVDWSLQRNQSKRNRMLVMIAVGFFILFVIAHPSSQPPTIVNSEEANKSMNGIAGDGHSSSTSASSHSNTSNQNSAQEISVEVEDAQTMEEGEVVFDKEADNPYKAVTPQEQQLIDKENAEIQQLEARLKISYLLSYPMSGTSFTMLLMSRTTNMTLATNYAQSAYATDDGKHIPVYKPGDVDANDEHVTIEGSPFWYTTYESTARPTKNVLTLSHCGGHCMYPCLPNQYVQTAISFDEQCRTVIDHTKDDDGKDKYTITVTPKKDVNNLIHLIRDPFSNIVSRFHAYLSQFTVTEKPFSNDRSGFKQWCEGIDNDEEVNEIEYMSSFFTMEMKELMKIVPCHSEFYKYVAWHNHVMEMAWNEDYEVLPIFYEDYANTAEQRQMAIKMAGFLEAPVVSGDENMPDYLKVRLYRDDYFTAEEITNIETFVRVVALKATMQLLERYFFKRRFHW